MLVFLPTPLLPHDHIICERSLIQRSVMVIHPSNNCFPDNLLHLPRVRDWALFQIVSQPAMMLTVETDLDTGSPPSIRTHVCVDEPKVARPHNYEEHTKAVRDSDGLLNSVVRMKEPTRTHHIRNLKEVKARTEPKKKPQVNVQRKLNTL